MVCVSKMHEKCQGADANSRVFRRPSPSSWRFSGRSSVDQYLILLVDVCSGCCTGCCTQDDRRFLSCYSLRQLGMCHMLPKGKRSRLFTDVLDCSSCGFSGGFVFVYVRVCSLKVVGVPVTVLVKQTNKSEISKAKDHSL